MLSVSVRDLRDGGACTGGSYGFYKEYVEAIDGRLLRAGEVYERDGVGIRDDVLDRPLDYGMIVEKLGPERTVDGLYYLANSQKPEQVVFVAKVAMEFASMVVKHLPLYGPDLMRRAEIPAEAWLEIERGLGIISVLYERFRFQLSTATSKTPIRGVRGREWVVSAGGKVEKLHQDDMEKLYGAFNVTERIRERDGTSERSQARNDLNDIIYYGQYYAGSRGETLAVNTYTSILRPLLVGRGVRPTGDPMAALYISEMREALLRPHRGHGELPVVNLKWYADES